MRDDALSVKTVGRAVYFLISAYILFSDDALRWLTSLPLQLNFSIAGVVIVGLSVFAYVSHHWPRRFEPYEERINGIFNQVRESLFAFAFVGLFKTFFALDLVLLPVIFYWPTWIVFAVEGLLFVNVWYAGHPARIVVRRSLK
jgi:hypothetical protein